MLRLLQKKLTAPQAEFTKHLLFVLSEHCILLLLLLVTSKTVTHMMLNIRTFNKNDNVIIKWRAAKSPLVSTMHSNVKVPAAHKPVSLKKNNPVPAQPFDKASDFAKASTDTTAYTQARSYRDLVNYVKNTPSSWDADGKLNAEFISAMVEKSRQLNLDNAQLESLLQTARDTHSIFSGNKMQNIGILQFVEAQIKSVLNRR